MSPNAASCCSAPESQLPRSRGDCPNIGLSAHVVTRSKCVHLLNWFDHRNHICLVFELLGMCVYDFLKDNEFAPFPRNQIQSFAKQLLDSVACACFHSLPHPFRTDVLCQFSMTSTSSTPTSNRKTSSLSVMTSEWYPYLALEEISPRQSGFSTRPISALSISGVPRSKTSTIRRSFAHGITEHQRSSSVCSRCISLALQQLIRCSGLGWSYPCDAFSLGCIFVEFYTGMALFQTHDNLEHLAMMEQVMGRMPDKFARAGARSKAEFFKEAPTGPRVAWPNSKASKQSRKEVKATKPIGDVIQSFDVVNRQFVDLVRKLLIFDPTQRLTVRDAMGHPYLQTPINGE